MNARSHPHQETAAVLAVVSVLAAADDAQLLTAEITVRCDWSPDQVDTVRRIALELEAAGWVTQHGSAKARRWILGFGLEQAAYAGRQSLAGRVLTPPAERPPAGHHRTAAAVVDLLTALTHTPLALSVGQLADASNLTAATARRVLAALTAEDWARQVPHPDGVARWRPSDALYTTAARRTSYWRTVSRALTLHLQLVDT